MKYIIAALLLTGAFASNAETYVPAAPGKFFPGITHINPGVVPTEISLCTVKLTAAPRDLTCISMPLRVFARISESCVSFPATGDIRCGDDIVKETF